MGMLDEIRAAVGEGLVAADLYRPAVLVKIVPGTRTPGSETSGTNPTTVSYPCKGLIARLTNDDVPGTVIGKEDRKVMLIGASLPAGIVPTTNDKVTIMDVDRVTKTYRLAEAVSGDGAGAAFSFAARR